MQPSSDLDLALAERLRMCVQDVGGGGEFSRRAGIPRSTLETYITGKATPKPERLAAICHVFDINGHWLLTGDGKMKTMASGTELKDAISTIQSVAKSLKPEMNSDQQTLLDAHARATPEMRKALINLAQAIIATSPAVQPLV